MIQSVLHVIVLSGLALVGCCILACIWRIARGPAAADRALAADTLSVLLIAMSLLLSVRTGTTMYFDGAIVLALLGFAGTVALAQFIARRVPPGRTGGPK